MYQQLVQQKNNLAHAYVLEGEPQQVVSDLYEFLSTDIKLQVTGNANIFDKK